MKCLLFFLTIVLSAVLYGQNSSLVSSNTSQIVQNGSCSCSNENGSVSADCDNGCGCDEYDGICSCTCYKAQTSEESIDFAFQSNALDQKMNNTEGTKLQNCGILSKSSFEKIKAIKASLNDKLVQRSSIFQNKIKAIIDTKA